MVSTHADESNSLSQSPSAAPIDHRVSIDHLHESGNGANSPPSSANAISMHEAACYEHSEAKESVHSGEESLSQSSSRISPRKPPRKRLNTSQKLTALIAFLTTVASIVVLSVPGVSDHLVDFMEYLRGQKITGPIIFISIYALSVVLTVPSILFGIGAGFVFPYEVAIPVVYVGSLSGAMLNFGIGRYFLVEMVEILCLSRSGSLREINKMLGNQSAWRLITLLRLPYVGMPQVSYMLAVSKASFRHFLIGTGLGILPVSVVIAIVGRQIENLSSGSASSGAPLVLTICLFVGAVAIISGVVIYARRALRRNARGSVVEEEVAACDEDATLIDEAAMSSGGGDFQQLPDGDVAKPTLTAAAAI